MKPRHFHARIAAFVTAAAAIAMFVGPARADAAADAAANQSVRSSMAQEPGFGIGSRVDGWANPDVDIGEIRFSVADELGSRLDGYDTPDMDLSSSSDMWEAMASGIGDILDGWANRDIDIGTF